jgi:NAD(P)-dependent dehydrogenase (short-subunit alcohol dehydrogenase family)
MAPANFSLDGRVALVTGAAGHLGQAMAEALAEAGARVLLNGRTQGNLEALRDRLRRAGAKADVITADITNEAATGEAMRSVASAYGRLDVLVNNAYAATPGNLATATSADFARSYDIAVTAAFHLVQQGRDLLAAAGRDTGSASVINVASMYATVSPDPGIYGAVPPNPPFYGPAKAGLLQLTRYLACHLAAARIRVNAISPGPFPAPKVAEANPDFMRSLEGKVPLGRIGQPEDLKGAIIFLASDASRYVTGINLPVDGGWTAW